MCPHFCIMMVFLYFCVIILHVNRCYNEKTLKPKSLCQEECKNAINDITILNLFLGGGGWRNLTQFQVTKLEGLKMAIFSSTPLSQSKLLNSFEFFSIIDNSRYIITFS